MIRSLAILAMTMLACCAALAQRTNDEIHLRATVQDVVILLRFSGSVTPVDVDPRFALTVRIESATPVVTNFAASSVVTFAIHSPVLLFAGEDAKGKTYDFSLRCRTDNKTVRYFGLKIRRKQANQGAAANRRPAKLSGGSGELPTRLELLMKSPAPNHATEAVMTAIRTKLDQSHEGKYLASLRALPRRERALWSTFIVECEVENGGFAQYFWNMENEEFYSEAIQGFTELGSTQHLAVFKEALELITPHLSAMHSMQGPEDRFKKYKPLLQKTGLYDELMRLDSRFYNLRPSLVEVRDRYIIQHYETL